MRRLLLGFLVIALSTNMNAAPPRKRASGARVSSAGVQLQSYASRVQNLTTCEEFIGRLSILPDATKMLEDLPYGSELGGRDSLAKDEFESTSAFNAREAAFWSKSLGDPSRIIIDAKLPTHGIEYNADTGVLTIKWVVDTIPNLGVSRVTFTQRFEGKRSYVAQNAYGATVSVDAFRVITGNIQFPQGQMKDDEGAASDLEWRIPMLPDEAREFKSSPHMMIWMDLSAPYLIKSVRLDHPTLDDPTDISHHDNIWTGNLKCAAFTMGNRRLIKQIEVSH